MDNRRGDAKAMTKKLKFAPPLPELIISGEKYTTWRINDEKGIQKGDELSLCQANGDEFAKAKVIGVRETTFGNLTRDDWEGHETFPSEKEMYETYSGYYGVKATPGTKVKIIKFRLKKTTAQS